MILTVAYSRFSQLFYNLQNFYIISTPQIETLQKRYI